MKKLLIVVGLLTLALIAQTGAPSQITLKPISAAGGCVSDAAGGVLCAASDGFYISVAGGTFQKIVAGTIPPPPSPTKIDCTTASLTAGTSGTFSASGCTLK
jgi:hypothetical protein